MKELKILESWADTIIQEKIEDRPLARSQDIQYKASQQFPDRSPEQALQLYVANKMADNDKMNLDQNKLINSQKRENEKLRRSLQDLGQELHDHERTAGDTEREVSRLKQLSARLGPAGQEQQQIAKASADKVQAMLNDLDNLKNKPGIDEKKFKELSDKVEQLKSKPIDNVEVEKIQMALAVMNKQKSVDDELFNKVMQRLEKTEQELSDKEQRFQQSLSRNAEKIGGWGNKFKDLDKKIKDIEGTTEIVFNDLADKQNQAEEMYTQSWATMKKTRELLKDIDNTKDEQQDMIDRLFDLVAQLNPDASNKVKDNVARLKTLSTNIKDKEDKEEADVAKIPPEPVSGEELELAQQSEPQQSDDELAQSLADKLKNKTIQFPKTQDERDIMQKRRMSEDNSKKFEDQPLANTQPNQNNEYSQEELEIGIREMIDLFNRRYPADAKEHHPDVIRKIIRKTIGGSLLILGDDITPQHIFKYLDRVQRVLHRTTQPTQPELPGIPRTNPNRQQYNNPKDSQIESLVTVYQNKLLEITNGY